MLFGAVLIPFFLFRVKELSLPISNFKGKKIRLKKMMWLRGGKEEQKNGGGAFCTLSNIHSYSHTLT